MKIFIAFVALVAVAVANPLLKPIYSETEQLEQIIAAIQSPSTDPATAALLEAMLADLLGVGTPVAGPAIVDFPVNEGSVEVSPVVIGDIPQGSTPLVQIIVNVRNSAPSAAVDAAAISPPAPIAADSVLIADSIPEVADNVLEVDNVLEADNALEADNVVIADLPVSGVAVADLEAPPVAPVVVGSPDLPSQIVNLPLELN